MGEESWRVKNFGYPVIDLIREGNYASPNEISKKLNISLKKPIIVFTLHPIPIEEENFDKNIINCLNALEKISLALKNLNWSPKYDLDEGLIDTIKYFKKFL